MRVIMALLLFLFLACCAEEPAKNSVDSISPAEAEALNDAAAMLDQTEPPPRLTQDKGDTPTPPAPAK